MTTKHKIAVGLSGGVDSAVSALLLKEQGHDVIGIFMQNWEVDNDDPYCSAEQDLLDAHAVAEKIGIEFHTINFAKDYWDNVFQYCLDEFSHGRTPNPDIWCNKEIKFKVFLQYALELGVDFLATGHYVRKREINGRLELLKGLDPIKDQSYFLYTLGQHQLKHALFPIGELEKPAVRKIATDAGLPNCTKKDSTGICFIGERNFKEFLQEFLLAKPGNIETVEGHVIGTHDGVMYYTLGQRKGLNIGGKRDANEQAWYVLEKDVARNVLIIGQGHDHPRLFRHDLTCEQLHWVSGHAPYTPFDCTARTRYHQDDQACTVSKKSDDSYLVEFKQPLRAITPGQSVVFYQHEICLGGGIIC